jgi:hypothetical protein
VSYVLPIVDMRTLPLVAGVKDHHTVFVRGFVLGFGPVVTQGGVGSVDSVVAAELSTTPTKLFDGIGIAFAKLSFIGGVPLTAKDCDAEVSPAFAASSVTLTKAVVPKATSVLEIVACIEVDVPPGSIVTPDVEPFQRICAFVAKLLPVAVSVKLGEPAAVDVGLIELRVGVDPAEAVIVDQAFTRFVPSIEPSPVA